MKQTIELEYEQVDAIIITELKKCHESAMVDLDFQLAKALELVLRQYMMVDDFLCWMIQVNGCQQPESLYDDGSNDIPF